MKYDKILYIIITLNFSLLANSGHETGNGGDAVVCRENNIIRTAELLDFYEARTMRDIEFKEQNGSVDEIVMRNFQKLNKYSPQNEKHFKLKFINFFNETKFLSNITLSDIPDSDHVALPVNCQIEQVAIQQTPIFLGDKKYIINKDIYDKFDNFNKAGLIQHELIYDRDMNLQDSKSARYANSIISSDYINYYSFTDFTQLLYQTPLLNKVNFANLEMNVEEPLYLSLYITDTEVENNSNIKKINFNFDGYNFILGQYLEYSTKLMLRSNNGIGIGLIENNIPLSYTNYFKVKRSLVNLDIEAKPNTVFSSAKVSFHSTGEIKKFFALITPMDLNKILKGSFAGTDIILKKANERCLDCGKWFGIEFELYPNGRIKKIFSGRIKDYSEFANNPGHIKYLYGELNKATFKIPQFDQEIYGVSFSTLGEVVKVWKN